MTDEELYNLVRENYLKCNKEHIEEQLRICKEEIEKLEAKQEVKSQQSEKRTTSQERRSLND